MSKADAMKVLSDFLAPTIQAQTVKPPDIVTWAEGNYYIPETGFPIELEPHQAVFARMFAHPERFKTATGADINTYVYSTVKKSGKTAFAGVCSRYAAEFSGNNSEIYFIANDKEQAKDRAYESAKTSIEKTPGYDHQKRTLPGQWRIIERQSVHLPTSSIMRAIAGDYEGAAGGNPTGTFWTELWAFTSERFKRLWDELTPVPTRARSFRFVETYAGFVDESLLLYSVYRRSVSQARRLTKDELAMFAPPGVDPWPFLDPPPFYINEVAGSLAYWDEDEAAQRRMPWQTSERGIAYYREQKENLRPEAYERLHLNKWVSSAQTFIQPAWWQACVADKPHIPTDWPIVLGVDGSVNSDCTAVVGVAREPIMQNGKLVASDTDVRIVFAKVWEPPRGGVIDLDEVEAYIRHIAGHHNTIKQKWPDRGYEDMFKHEPTYNIVHVTYDMYQLHQMQTSLSNDFVAWTKPFSQAGAREVSDKQLYDLIVRRGIHHNNEFDPQFMYNAAAYVAGENAKNQDRLRIVKKAPDAKVDPVVCLSMAAFQCLYLLLS